MRQRADISICMPYWQRQAELDRSLAAYRRLYAHLNVEFSICDDGSPIPVKADGCTVTYLPKKNIGLNACVPMNSAIRASSSDIIVITNPEIEHREDVFTEMLSMLQNKNDYVIAHCRDDDGTWLAGEQVDYTKDGRLPVPDGSHFHFCAMMYRSFFDKVGGFDEAYRFGRACDDNDWLWTLHAHGANFKLAKGVVWHYRTPHKYQGTLKSNKDLLFAKWSHNWL